LDVAKIKKHKKIIRLLETALGLEEEESNTKKGFLNRILSIFKR
jgi:hypothetical protein